MSYKKCCSFVLNYFSVLFLLYLWKNYFSVFTDLGLLSVFSRLELLCTVRVISDNRSQQLIMARNISGEPPHKRPNLTITVQSNLGNTSAASGPSGSKVNLNIIFLTTSLYGLINLFCFLSRQCYARIT